MRGDERHLHRVQRGDRVGGHVLLGRADRRGCGRILEPEQVAEDALRVGEREVIEQVEQQPRVVQLVAAVLPETPDLQHGDRQRVGHAPRLRSETEEAELRGSQRRIGPDFAEEAVHAVGERLERDAALGRQLLELLLELGLGEAVAPHDDVAGEVARAEKADLRETPLPGAPEELELDHAVLRRGIALCESEGLQLRGLAAEAGWNEDVRHAPLVARDRDRGSVGRAAMPASKATATRAVRMRMGNSLP
jgi:hypothetical protein